MLNRTRGLLVVAVIALAIVNSGCGANGSKALETPNSTAENVQVLVTPNVAGVLAGQTQQFNATVTGTTTTAVSWSVGGVAGGNASLGVISNTGLYTAPATPPSAAVTITATSQASSGSTGSANVAVMSPGTVTETNNLQVAQYSLNVPLPATVSVQFGPTTAYGLSTWSVSTPSGGGTVNILVAGMRASTAYHMQATVDFTGGPVYHDVDQTFTTGALPSDLVPQVVATTPGSLIPNGGIELLDLVNEGGNRVDAAAVDLQGNLIWYYNYPNPQSRLPEPIKLLPNGHMLLVLGTGSSAPINGLLPPDNGTTNVIQEIDLAGNLIRQLTLNDLNSKLASAGYNFVALTMHHDILPLPTGHTIVIFNILKNVGGNDILGDVLVDLDPNWNPVWTWSTFDHLDVNRRPISFLDWTHSNAVIYSPVGGNLILSMRHQSWIIKIDYEDGQGSGNILWRLGQGGDFTLTNGTDIDWFYAQHYPVLLTPNRGGVIQLAVWDNGNNRIVDSSGDLCGAPGQIACYSRPVIFQVDESARTATILWQDVLSLFSPWGGSVESLANGNFEFDANAYGGADAMVFEVTQEDTPQIVWQLQINSQAAYRAFRIPSLYPGVQW